MKIYTRRGDDGETDLFGGERVFKSHLRVKAYGEIDAANCAIGMAASTADIDEDLKGRLIPIMQLLFVAGAEVATSPKEHAQNLLSKRLSNIITEEHITSIEANIDELEQKLLELKNFILPCGTELSARLHFARTMVRRAEISLVELSQHEAKGVRAEILKYFNRLSDLLFVMARAANHLAGTGDIAWSGSLLETP